METGVPYREIMDCGLFLEDTEHLTAPEIYTFPASPRLAAGYQVFFNYMSLLVIRGT